MPLLTRHFVALLLLLAAPLGLTPEARAQAGVYASPGGSHTCAILNTGAVKCWGLGANGRLGYGDSNNLGDGAGEMGDALPAVNLGTGRTATQVAPGGSHTCAVLDTGAVKCWGSGLDGRLGYGDSNSRGDGAGEMGDALPAVDLGTGRTATQIALGTNHTCALLDTGAVKCWGVGGSGQLGYGDTATRGDGAGEMGDALPAVNLGTGRTATKIGVVGFHSCAILDTGAVKCWGMGGSGRLGYGDTANRGDGAGEMGDALPAVNLGTGRTATQIALGSAYTCALLDTGAVKCWGFGANGQLGYGDNATRGDQAFEMGDALPAVNLGTGRTATKIAAAASHTCVLLDTGAAKCWGSGGSGRLGYGDTATRGDGAGEMGDALPAVNLGTGRTAMQISPGASHTCAVLDTGAAKCWGSGMFGRLGYGDTATRGDEAGEMGDALPVVDLGTGAVLPVELVAFTATADGPAAVLTWTTVSETGNAGFSVETLRSAVWAEVAFVAGRGTTSEAHTYRRTVSGLAPGRHAFRLRQLDTDGVATLSATVQVVIDGEGRLRIYPSPSRTNVRIDGLTASADVVDALGRVVARAAPGEVLSVAGWAPGVYVLMANEPQRFVVAR